jgi:hypothetical protein
LLVFVLPSSLLLEQIAAVAFHAFHCKGSSITIILSPHSMLNKVPLNHWHAIMAAGLTSVTTWNKALLEKLIVHSDSQEITRLFWNLKVHYRVHKSLPMVPILCKMNLIHSFELCFPKIHVNIILPSIPRSVEWSLPFRLCNQNFVHISYFSISSSLIWSSSYLVKSANYGAPPSRHFIPLSSKYLLCTLFSDTLNLFSPLTWETRFCTHTKQQVKQFFLYFNLYV